MAAVPQPQAPRLHHPAAALFPHPGANTPATKCREYRYVDRASTRLGAARYWRARAARAARAEPHTPQTEPVHSPPRPDRTPDLPGRAGVMSMQTDLAARAESWASARPDDMDAWDLAEQLRRPVQQPMAIAAAAADADTWREPAHRNPELVAALVTWARSQRSATCYDATTVGGRSPATGPARTAR